MKPAVYETGAMLVFENNHWILRNNNSERAEISPGNLIVMKANPPTDAEPGDIPLEDNSKPDFSHLWGDVKLAHAIKDELNDPDSYKTISIGEAVADNFNGMACYTVLVNFFVRNGFNTVTRNSAYVSVMKMGGNWEVVL